MKLADFGIHHAVRDAATEITQFRLVTTEGWMCPSDQQDPIQPSFDVFSLGCVCGFLFLNGFHPFGTDPISGIRNKQPIRLIFGHVTCSFLSPALLDLIARMLNFDSAKRPSASDVLSHPVLKQQHLAVVSAPSKHADHRQMPELEPLFPFDSKSTPHHANKNSAPSVLHETADLLKEHLVHRLIKFYNLSFVFELGLINFLNILFHQFTC